MKKALAEARRLKLEDEYRDKGLEPPPREPEPIKAV